jgi:type IV pilus assembly protein PilC
MDASSKRALRETLRKMNFIPIAVATRRKLPRGSWNKRIRNAEILVFARQFGALYECGVPLITALHSVERDSENPALREILRDVANQLEAGATLRDAFGKHQDTFSEFFLGMVEAGEAAGMLDRSLEHTAIHIEGQEQLRQKVVSAFAYPLVVSILCFLTVAFLTVFVVPVFASAYAKNGILLPLATRLLIALSEFIRHCYWWAGPLAVATGVFVWKILRRPELKQWIDIAKINIPLFGQLNRKVAVTRFIRTFGLMSANGVSLLHSLAVAEKVANNYLISQAAEDVRQAVNAGAAFSGPLAAHAIFPSIVLQMAATGENTGQMPEMLQKAADFLDRDIDHTVKRLIIILEPLLTVILAAVVGFVLLAVYLPMFDIMKMAK